MKLLLCAICGVAQKHYGVHLRFWEYYARNAVELFASQQFRKYTVSRMIATTETESENRLIPPSRIAGTAEKSIPHASQYGA